MRSLAANRTIVNVVIAVQVCMQALLGAAHGRVLCIPFCDCPGEEQAAAPGVRWEPTRSIDVTRDPRGCDHRQERSVHREHRGLHDHHDHRDHDSHRGCELAMELHGDSVPLTAFDAHCECHLHLPFPADPQIAGRRLARLGDIDQPIAMAPPVIAVMALDFAAPPSVRPLARPPDVRSDGSLRSLRSTRLLI